MPFNRDLLNLPLLSMASPIYMPWFIHVGSAGVTRVERPGLDLSKQPPAVRMNKELGSILTFKLKGEGLIRESGIPYTIIRPCALTEEPAGAILIFEQGDNITNPPPEKDYDIYFSTLKDGITGKEALEKSHVPV